MTLTRGDFRTIPRQGADISQSVVEDGVRVIFVGIHCRVVAGIHIFNFCPILRSTCSCGRVADPQLQFLWQRHDTIHCMENCRVVSVPCIAEAPDAVRTSSTCRQIDDIALHIGDLGQGRNSSKDRMVYA